MKSSIGKGGAISRRGQQVANEGTKSGMRTSSVQSDAVSPPDSPMKRSKATWNLMTLDEYGEPQLSSQSDHANNETTTTFKKRLPPDPWEFMMLDEFGEPYLVPPMWNAKKVQYNTSNDDDNFQRDFSTGH